MLSASWLGVRNHPWTSFATEPAPIDDPQIGGGPPSVPKIRDRISISRPRCLARFKDKIEHSRMTKGTGQAILDILLSERIIFLKKRDFIFS